jgi:hypothetical protein
MARPGERIRANTSLLGRRGRELPQLSLLDALELAMLIARKDTGRFQRVATGRESAAASGRQWCACSTPVEYAAIRARPRVQLASLGSASAGADAHVQPACSRTHADPSHGACEVKYQRSVRLAVEHGVVPRSTITPMRAPSRSVIRPHERRPAACAASAAGTALTSVATTARARARRRDIDVLLGTVVIRPSRRTETRVPAA